MKDGSFVMDRDGDHEGPVLELLAGDLLHELEDVSQLGGVLLEEEHVLLAVWQGNILIGAERDRLLDIRCRGFIQNPLPFAPVTVEMV